MAIGLIFKHHRSEGKRKKKKIQVGWYIFSLAACKVGMIRNLKKGKTRKERKRRKKKSE